MRLFDDLHLQDVVIFSSFIARFFREDILKSSEIIADQIEMQNDQSQNEQWEDKSNCSSNPISDHLPQEIVIIILVPEQYETDQVDCQV